MKNRARLREASSHYLVFRRHGLCVVAPSPDSDNGAGAAAASRQTCARLVPASKDPSGSAARVARNRLRKRAPLFSPRKALFCFESPFHPSSSSALAYTAVQQ
ncbi:hypothetical protein MRX96_047674 [Rhipicephalus microplus]